MGKGKTEAQRGARPCLGSHSGFPFCLHSQLPQASAGSRVGRGEEGGLKERSPTPLPTRQHRFFRASSGCPRAPSAPKFVSVQDTSSKRQEEETDWRARQATPGQRGRSPSIPNTQLSVREVAVSFAVEGAETFSPLSCHPQGECQLGRPSRQQEGDSEVRLVKGTPKRGNCNHLGGPGKKTSFPVSSSAKLGKEYTPGGHSWGARGPEV